MPLLATEVGRYLEKLQGFREGLVAAPSILPWIVVSLTCAAEFLSNLKLCFSEAVADCEPIFVFWRREPEWWEHSAI